MTDYPEGYPRPPIVEAVIDFRFTGSAASYLEQLQERLGENYPKRDVVQADDKSRTTATDLSSTDNRRHLICADDMLSVHVLAPYPGWQNFLAQAKEALAVLPDTIRRKGLSGIGVRYMDRIQVPGDAEDLSFNDYITIMPPRPSGMPESLASFTVALSTVDPKTNTNASLMVTSLEEDSGSLSFVCDVQVFRAAAADTPFSMQHDEAWVDVLDDLHRRQRDIFEASITQKTRGLFQ